MVQNSLNLSPKSFFPLESWDIPYEVWLLPKECQNYMSNDIGIFSKSNFQLPVAVMSMQKQKT
jgi:hypothetical protein